MDNQHIELTVDVPAPETLRLTLADGDRPVVSEDVVYQGHVDNLLLTAVDNLLRRSNLDRSALVAVKLGAGIDKNSSLCRIVQSFASAIAAAHQSFR